MSDASTAYACPHCDRGFSTAVGLNSHLRIHKPLVHCESCGEDVKNLNMHMRKFHPQEMGTSEVEQVKLENLRLQQQVGRLTRENQAYRSKLGKLLRSGISV